MKRYHIDLFAGIDVLVEEFLGVFCRVVEGAENKLYAKVDKTKRSKVMIDAHAQNFFFLLTAVMENVFFLFIVYQPFFS